jgi:ABC-type sugar transport system substrate-binding protein
VVESGWHDILVQAKKAKIPVILVDRKINEKDKSLYASYIGSDFQEEGRRSAICLLDVLDRQKLHGQVNIVELRGTEGSAPAIDRKRGFAEVLASHPNYKIIRSENGDFKEALGKEWMEKILKQEKAKGVTIQALFAHNDNMALGAISAIEAAGLKPGKDIPIVSVDAIKNAFIAMKAGKLNCSVECSPLLGPQLMAVVKDLVGGKKLPPLIITHETVFPAENAERELPNRTY